MLIGELVAWERLWKRERKSGIEKPVKRLIAKTLQRLATEAQRDCEADDAPPTNQRTEADENRRSILHK